ncbi:MAG: FkbM family methyltransferase [Parvibaculum sp.]|nr:FkbM family methyltransferase [Parvibaculum sp.]
MSVTTGAAAKLSFRQRITWGAHLFKALAYQYHRPLATVLRGLIPRDGVIVDVGAHAGQHSKLFARMAPRGHVYAFEPGVYALSILKIVIGLRGFSNVSIVKAGLSDSATTETLHVPLKRRGSVGFGLSHIGAAADGRATVAEEIKLTTLDIFARENGLSRLDFIKVDIEGWEAHFLRGAKETIARFRPSLLLEVVEPSLERAGSTAADIFDALMPLGYVVFETFESLDYALRPVPGFEKSADYLFVPQERAHLVSAVVSDAV